MRSSLCIEMILTEYPFLERIGRAAALGCDAVEFWAWADKDLDALAAAARTAGVAVSAFSANRRAGLTNPAERTELLADVGASLAAARRLGAQNLIVLADTLGPGGAALKLRPGLTAETQQRSMLEGLQALAPLAEAAGVTLVLEPLNTYVDHGGYFLAQSAPAFALVQAVGSPYVKVLFDIYHMQIMEGNITATLTANSAHIGHIHVADVPGRHEPGSGELNYHNIIAALRQAGYSGYVGFEFAPSGRSEDAVAGSLALLKDPARRKYTKSKRG